MKAIGRDVTKVEHKIIVKLGASNYLVQNRFKVLHAAQLEHQTECVTIELIQMEGEEVWYRKRERERERERDRERERERERERGGGGREKIGWGKSFFFEKKKAWGLIKEEGRRVIKQIRWRLKK